MKESPTKDVNISNQRKSTRTKRPPTNYIAGQDKQTALHNSISTTVDTTDEDITDATKLDCNESVPVTVTDPTLA